MFEKSQDLIVGFFKEGAFWMPGVYRDYQCSWVDVWGSFMEFVLRSPHTE